jgi:signal transduction histidine kinase
MSDTDEDEAEEVLSEMRRMADQATRQARALVDALERLSFLVTEGSRR